MVDDEQTVQVCVTLQSGDMSLFCALEKWKVLRVPFLPFPLLLDELSTPWSTRPASKERCLCYTPPYSDVGMVVTLIV